MTRPTLHLTDRTIRALTHLADWIEQHWLRIDACNGPEDD